MDLTAAKTEYALRMGDNALIAGQRLAEWCGHGPQLELDIAFTNLSLDLVGQARLWLSLAGKLEGQGRDEDALAFHRDVLDFKNCLLVEQPNGDWGQTVARQFLFSAWQHLVYTELSQSQDEDFAAIAAKSLKEVSYHVRFSADWMRRLGDGTGESHIRMETALDALWRFTPELFESDAVDAALAEAGTAPDPAALRGRWDEMIGQVLSEATLKRPEAPLPATGGRKGHHTEHLGHLLADMQYLQRAYPNATW